MNNYKFDTLSVHGGYSPEPTTHSNVLPIYMTTAYNFDSVEHARSLFALEQTGNIYTRLQNPTNTAFEERISLLEGGIGAVAASSGHAAITMALLTLCSCGDEVISSSTIYGGAINLLGKTFDRMGIKVHFADMDDLSTVEAKITDKTKAIFAEAIGNPKADIADIRGLSEIAKKYGIPLIIDNTFATPALLRPIEYGADLVIHSATKYLAGSSTVMGGAIVDSGNFKWKDNPRFPEFNTPDESYHGIVYADACGNAAFITKVRTHILRDIGACQSPFNSWVTMLGLETLSLRMKKHSENALKVAEFLQTHPMVLSVDHPALPGSKYYRLANEYLPDGCSGVFTFEIRGGREAGAKFCDNLKLLRIVANLGDTRSMVSHPATTTHSQLSDEQLLAAGISASTIRLSIGIEDVDDIISDISAALDACK
ncbi:MAG: O-acetylhomoserine aminocarboxypropyltransferase/cysteine synthase [Oscillospiraceae bacterium]|nr:O-acetylhomoserine aminocarboxypropyltransferase/cysteine synthase [Oscillospiraceae bacterium]